MVARPNVLMISPFMPDRSGTGAQQRAATLLTVLQSDAEVTLWILRGVAGSRPAHPGLGVPVIHFPMSGPTAKDLEAGSTEELSRLAIAGEIRRTAMLPAARFDLAVCFRLQSAVFLERAEYQVGPLAKRRITDLDDVESVLLQRLGAIADRTGPGQSAESAHRAHLARRAEDRCLASHDLVMVASPTDETRLRQLGHDVCLAVSPNCVPWPEAPVRQRKAPAEIALTFVGNYGYQPNVDAVEWFVGDVLPELIQHATVGFRVDIVGYNMDRLQASVCDGPRLRLVGEVQTLRPTYEESDIVIAPVRVGSGTRMKILEAMSYGLPVVSTSAGIEGIRAVSDEHVLLADCAADFAHACADLMIDARLRRMIGTRARSLIHSYYTVDAVAPLLRTLIFGDGAGRGRGAATSH